jgi:hypothetical protein
MKIKIHFNALIFLFLILQINAQEWGVFTPEELIMQSPDNSSDAIILFDLGEMYINDDFELINKQHKRIKILTENGKRYGDITLLFGTNEEFEEIEAQVRLPNGMIIELDEDNIYEQSIEHWKQKVFSLPGVEVGSIIEYRYELISNSMFFLKPWNFQNDEFTLKSEFSLIAPKSLKYEYFLNNIYGFKIIHNHKLDDDPYGDHYKVIINSWKTENIPALRNEPFMYNLYDNYAKITFQLNSMDIFFFTINLLNSWVDIVNIQKTIYDEMLKHTSGTDTLAQKIMTDFLPPLANARSLFTYVRDNITTIESDTSGNDSLANIILSKRGTALEKNLFLIGLLRQAGYSANLLLISSRDNGKFNPTSINIKKLNYALVYLTIENKKYILDTSNKFCPFDIIPVNYNVDKGVLIEEKSTKIIQVFKSNLDNKVEITTNASIDTSGTLKCQSHLEISGIPAMTERNTLSQTPHNKYIEELLSKRYINVEIDTFSIPNDFIVNSQLDIYINYTVPEFAQLSDSLMYLEIPIFSKLTANPFLLDNRNFPIDYDYEIFESEVINLNYPENYLLEDIPNKSKKELPGCSFNSLIFTGNNSVEIRKNYRLKKLSFSPEIYSELKDLYDIMVKSDQSQIVLHKK